MSALARGTVVFLSAVLGPSFAFAQTDLVPEPSVSFCDPLLTESEKVDIEEVTRERRYDLEEAKVLGSDLEIMNALFEEKWDFQSGAAEPRHELCDTEPSYVVHWVEILDETESGEIVPEAKGLFSFNRDGSFEYVYSKRPYTGTWTLDDLEITLEASWLNDGEPYTTPVEHVVTPVEINYSDGVSDTYCEQTYRLGWFRFLRIATTVPGELRDCACPAPQQ